MVVSSATADRDTIDRRPGVVGIEADERAAIVERAVVSDGDVLHAWNRRRIGQSLIEVEADARGRGLSPRDRRAADELMVTAGAELRNEVKVSKHRRLA